MGEKNIYEGPITITRTGKGFFAFDENEEDMFIPGEALGGAFPGDIVRVVSTGTSVDPRTRIKRQNGRVDAIVSRSREKFVGKLIVDEGRTLLIPDWKKMYVPFLVRGENLPIGSKVVLTLGGWEEKAPYPWGTVTEVIGEAGVHETEMRAVALSQGFSSDFPPGVVAEAKQLEETGEAMIAAEAARSVKWGEAYEGYARRDFRDITTFTIDPADAKDFDDALSIRTLSNGDTEVGI
ncbi:MAG: RNB domain-containing ribonuclease, partial [Minisyncoccia bacterium]